MGKPMIDQTTHDYFEARDFSWYPQAVEFTRVGDDGIYQVLSRLTMNGNDVWQAAGFPTESGYIPSADWIGPVFPDPITAYVNAELSLWRDL